MEEKQSKSLTVIEQGIQYTPAFSEVAKTRFRKKKIKEPKVTYECVGTAEENQEILDRVFDRVFDEVLKRRQGRNEC